MIKFGTLLIEGFGSIGNNLEYNLNSLGINVLNARNGVGKTTIFSAWVWCLYGKTLKNKNSVITWEDKQPKDYNGCRVISRFRKGGNTYSIIRHEDYKVTSYGAKGGNRLLLIENGIERLDLRDKKDVQKEIIKILGFSFELFKNSVIFGQKMKRLIEEDGPTKKKIFEEIFETEYLQKAKENAEKEKANLGKEISELIININSKNEILKNKEESHNSINKLIADFHKRNLGDLLEVNNGIEKYQKKLNDTYTEATRLSGTQELQKQLRIKLKRLYKREEKLKEAESLLFKIEFTLGQSEAEVTNEKRLHKHLLLNQPKTCSVCKQPISKERRQAQKIENKEWVKESIIKQRELGIKINLLKVEQMSLKSYIADCKGLKEIIKKNQDNLNKENNNILKLESLSSAEREYTYNIGILQIKIKKINARKIPYDSNILKGKIIKLRKLTYKLNKRHKELQAEYNIQDWLIKDPLSNSGIKAYIFNQMLQAINQRLLEYSPTINRVINFGMDLESGNKDFYITIEEKKNIRFYQDLSGGEQQLINVCIAFAVHDVISMEKEVNVLVADEIFESLDPQNIDIVSNLIQQKAIGKSLHIITHHQGFIPTNAKFINLYIKKGITYKR